MSKPGNKVVPIRERRCVVLPIVDATPPEMYREFERELAHERRKRSN